MTSNTTHVELSYIYCILRDKTTCILFIFNFCIQMTCFHYMIVCDWVKHTSRIVFYNVCRIIDPCLWEAWNILHQFSQPLGISYVHVLQEYTSVSLTVKESNNGFIYFVCIYMEKIELQSCKGTLNRDFGVKSRTMGVTAQSICVQ